MLKNSKRCLLILVALCLFFAMILYFSLAVFVGLQAQQDTKTRSDAILILGARSYVRGDYNPCLEARVAQATKLYKGKYAPRLLISGGDDKEDGINEAETMKKLAVAEGVKASDILLEKSATSTYENFSLSQKILRAHHLHSIIIVTEPFHVARASLVAQKLHLSYTVSPATASPCWTHGKYLSRYFLKEPVAIMVYALQGKL